MSLTNLIFITDYVQECVAGMGVREQQERGGGRHTSRNSYAERTIAMPVAILELGTFAYRATISFIKKGNRNGVFCRRFRTVTSPTATPCPAARGFFAFVLGRPSDGTGNGDRCNKRFKVYVGYRRKPCCCNSVLLGSARRV